MNVKGHFFSHTFFIWQFLAEHNELFYSVYSNQEKRANLASLKKYFYNTFFIVAKVM